MKTIYVIFYRNSFGYSSPDFNEWQPRAILTEGYTLLSYVTEMLIDDCQKVTSIDRDAILEFQTEPADPDKHRQFPKRVQYTLRAIKGTLPE